MSEQSVPEEKVSSDTNNNTSGNNNNICRDYQRGVCNRGGKCKFNHPEGMGTELQSPPLVCRDFQNGKCGRSTCKYLHISNEDEKVYLRTGTLPPRSQMAPQMGGSMLRAGGYHGYGQMMRTRNTDPICKDFLNSKCSRGNACKFRHVYEDENGYGGGYEGYDDFPRKRRRDSSGGDYSQLREENESLHRKLAELQKQISDLKATNEVLLEQNARYRNHEANTGYYSSSKTASTTNYTSSYPPRESSSAYTSSTASGAYNSGAYSATGYASGSGYTKFE